MKKLIILKMPICTLLALVLTYHASTLTSFPQCIEIV